MLNVLLSSPLLLVHLLLLNLVPADLIVVNELLSTGPLFVNDVLHPLCRRRKDVVL